MSEYETRITRLTVNKKGEPIFSPFVTNIEIEDQAAGEYLVVEQIGDDAEPGKIWIDPEQWPHIKGAIEHLLATITPDPSPAAPPSLLPLNRKAIYRDGLPSSGSLRYRSPCP